MGNPFKKPKAPKIIVQEPPEEKPVEPVDPEALRRARERAEMERKRRGRRSLRIDLLGSTGQGELPEGIFIP